MEENPIEHLCVLGRCTVHPNAIGAPTHYVVYKGLFSRQLLHVTSKLKKDNMAIIGISNALFVGQGGKSDLGKPFPC